MTTEEATQVVLELLSDPHSPAHTVVRDTIFGPGVENERDAAKYLEIAILDLLRDDLLLDDGQTAREFAQAVDLDPNIADPYEVVRSVDWLEIGTVFWKRYLVEFGYE